MNTHTHTKKKPAGRRGKKKAGKSLTVSENPENLDLIRASLTANSLAGNFIFGKVCSPMKNLNQKTLRDLTRGLFTLRAWRRSSESPGQ